MVEWVKANKTALLSSILKIETTEHL